MRYAFTFDAASCTGCKACQVACKDKNQLGAGVLWRRVYEVSGGGWERRGAAWTNTVFAYNVSIGCNHCADPACAGACPTGAYAARDDGIVVHEPPKCIGCEYCAWACPYGAPQFSAESGRVSKCDFCCDLIDAGLPPACVAACPMRALDVSRVESAMTAAPSPFPFPSGSRTHPQIVIAPHRAMSATFPKAVANREEVRPRSVRRLAGMRVAELPLVGFTLFAQAAAGLSFWTLIVGVESGPLFFTTGLLIAAAGLLSLLHLSRPASAWKASANLARSALSREIVAFGVFAAAWILTPLLPPLAARVALAASGAVLIESMARVYLIDGLPRWNTWRTLATFAGSALLLGGMGAALTMYRLPAWGWALSLVVLAGLTWNRARFYACADEKDM